MSKVIEIDSSSAVASPYQLSAAEVLARLKSDEANGLSERAKIVSSKNKDRT